MVTTNGNVCTRCGKLRIVTGTYKETVGNSSVTYTQTACSDIECQKLVNEDLLKDEKKRVVLKNEQEHRVLLRKSASRV